MVINMAVIGAGRIGQIHAGNAARNPGVRLAGIAGVAPAVCSIAVILNQVASAIPVGEVKDTAHIGQIDRKFANRRKLIKDQRLPPIHGVIDIFHTYVVYKSHAQTVHHKPAQGLRVVKMEIFFLLPVIKSRNQGRAFFPIHGNSVRSIAVCHKEIQTRPFGKPFRQLFCCQFSGVFHWFAS